jgi:hypothetical protein
MINLQPYEQLEAFNQSLEARKLWTPYEGRALAEEARFTIVCAIGERPEAPYELLARRHHNMSGRALKVNFWAIESRPTYLGTLGHHPDATTYCKRSSFSYEKAELYEIMKQQVQ